MNFTKEEARQKLTDELSRKVENIGSWERTINENVETLFSFIGENDTLTIDEFVSKAIPIFVTASGHIRKETSDVAKKFEAKVKELEEKGKKTQAAANNAKTDDDVMKSLIERIIALEQKNATTEHDKAVRDKKSAISAKIVEGGVSDTEWVEAVLSKAAISEETDVESEAKSYVEMYNKMFASRPKNVTPKSAGGTAEDRLKETINAAAEYAKSQRLAD